MLAELTDVDLVDYLRSRESKLAPVKALFNDLSFPACQSSSRDVHDRLEQVFSTVSAPDTLDPINRETEIEALEDPGEKYVGFDVNTLQLRTTDNVGAPGVWRQNTVL